MSFPPSSPWGMTNIMVDLQNKQLQSGQEYVFFVLAVMEHFLESVSEMWWHPSYFLWYS